MMDLLAGSVPIKEADNSALIPHLEAIKLWWSGDKAIRCATGENLGCAFYQRDGHLWYISGYKWRHDNNTDMDVHHKNLLEWEPDTKWEIIPPPDTQSC
jgi:hypothetical protein